MLFCAPLTAAPGGNCPPLPPLCYATALCENKLVKVELKQNGVEECQNRVDSQNQWPRFLAHPRASIPIQAGRSLRPPKNRGKQSISVFFTISFSVQYTFFGQCGYRRQKRKWWVTHKQMALTVTAGTRLGHGEGGTWQSYWL